jgi:hypothetical protein
MKRSCIRAGDIQIPEQQQLVTAAPTTCGHGFKCANNLWKAPGVYFHMHQTSQVHIMSEPAAIIILVSRSFSTNDAATPYFGPLGCVSC